MSISRPTLQNIVDQISADFKANITGATTLALRSVLQVMARVYAGAVHMLYGYIDNLTKQLFATTASSAYLDIIGSEIGVMRLSASPAVGNIMTTGTNGTAIPAGTLLQITGGAAVYATNTLNTIPLSGSISVACTATVGASISNQPYGAGVSFVSPIVGVNSAATIDIGGMTGGTDVETDAAYRLRILSRKKFAPQGGCVADYIAWCKECAGVTRAWVVPLYQGVGTFAVYFVNDVNEIPTFPNPAQVAVVDAYLRSHVDTSGLLIGCPVSANPGLFTMVPTSLPINMSVGLNPNNSTTQAAVTAALVDLFYRLGGPGVSIRNSQVSAAIATATGIIYSTWTAGTPALDGNGNYVVGSNQIPILGTLTFTSI